MDHGTPRSGNRTASAFEAHDLGNEPPLSVDGESTLVDRRRVSLQWFSGTILTGLCGAALMGGAVFASLDGESNFATHAERQEASLRGAVGLVGPAAGTVRKGDRLPAASELTARRQVLRVSTTTRVGSREVVRVQPFVRVAGNLALAASELSAGLPPFNPQKLMEGPAQESNAAPEATAAAPDAEVSFVMRDLGPVLPRARIGISLPMEDVIGRVREAAHWSVNTPLAATPVPALHSAGVRLAYAPSTDPALDPYGGFEPRIVPENITLQPKTQADAGSAFNERIVLVKKGDTLASVLKDLNATAEEIQGFSSRLTAYAKDGGLKEGQKLRILVAPASALGQRLAPVRIIVDGEDGMEAIVALSDLGHYVPVDIGTRSGNSRIAATSDEDDEETGTGVRLYQSIYESAMRQQIPRGVIDEMIRIYSFDVDFQRRSQPGDSFEVLFAGEEDGTPSEHSDVLFASLTLGDEVKKFYRFQSSDDGIVDYYDETGKSAKKFLVRKPVNNGVMRSGFGGRRHPILGYTKMHTGVDWAAPYGTPIFAAGNGVVEQAGWEGGYGRYIRLRHTNGYETAYGHMTAFARGMSPGTRVRQGQVIGFVGSTGLSTGPHVHFEILVNSRFVDPMRIRLPRGRVLEGRSLAAFEQERERIDSMMSRPIMPSATADSPTRTAQAGR